MLNFIFILLSAVFSIGASFNIVTAQNANTGGYTALPEAVRDIYSQEIFFEAMPRLRFLQFAKVKRDLTAIKGKSITFTKYDNLLGGGSVAEDASITPQAMVAADIQITVIEQGNAITVSELLLKTSPTDVLGEASKLLANNVAKVLDGQLRDAVLATTNIKFGNGVATVALMDSTSKFNSVVIKDAAELLATNNAPKIEGEYYVCICHPSQARQMRDDPNWVGANQYNGRAQIYKGEVGMYEATIFIETTQMPKLNTAAVVAKYGAGFTPAFGCEAVMFGENAYAWAVALDVELRDDGVIEMGRKHTLGWYGIWGSGIIEGKNSVRILTAHTS